jgi:hypothetical protein
MSLNLLPIKQNIRSTIRQPEKQEIQALNTGSSLRRCRSSPSEHCEHDMRPLYGCGAEVRSLHATVTLTLVMIGKPGEFLLKHSILNYYRSMTPGFILSADVKDCELRASTKVLLNNHSHDKHSF